MDVALLLEKAQRLAEERHRGQIDKAGQPYIGHPRRVMEKMPTPELRIVAILHDLIEDTPETLASLRGRGFPETVLRALDALTRGENESYSEFIARVKLDPLAAVVKKADLEDNMDLTRIPTPGPADEARNRKYRKAYKQLTGEDYR